MEWEPGTAVAPLREDEVHVWRVDMGAPGMAEEAVAAVLSEDERERAQRFRFEKGRRQYSLCRGILRMLLGAYLERPVEALRFAYGEQGKPELAGPDGAAALQFNLSHSAHLALMAFAWNRAVGVDVERRDPRLEGDKLARRFFAPGDLERLDALPEGERHQAFFDCWARKEAYMKACGQGMHLGLEQFEVSVTPGEASLLRVEGQPGAPGRWQLEALTPGDGFAGALAVEGPPLRLRCFQWQGLG